MPDLFFSFEFYLVLGKFSILRHSSLTTLVLDSVLSEKIHRKSFYLSGKFVDTRQFLLRVRIGCHPNVILFFWFNFGVLTP